MHMLLKNINEHEKTHALENKMKHLNQKSEIIYNTHGLENNNEY